MSTVTIFYADSADSDHVKQWLDGSTPQAACEELPEGRVLISTLGSDIELSQITDPSSFLDHALLWLHEQGSVTHGRGVTIFRPAITVRLGQGNRKFTETEFQPLHIHYDEQTLQTRIMAAYAQRARLPCAMRSA